jgi:pimeloyl-ACP methyl ester carboxylesterase
MTLSTDRFTTDRIAVGSTMLYVLKGGEGPPCVVLHGIEGDEGHLAFHDALADRTTVYAPSHPGYGYTDCPAWISTVPHQAVFYNWFLQQAFPHGVDLIGIGLGGWIAAQMAVQCDASLRHLVLVNPAGVKPEQDEILDVFVTPWRTVIEQGFFDARTSAEYQRIYSNAPLQEFGGVRESGRVMSMRMCFKPYMYDPALPGMLAKIRTPTLIVHGTMDRIMPIECSEHYHRAIPNATLKLLDNCGHFAHLDQPEALANTIREFIQ